MKLKNTDCLAVKRQIITWTFFGICFSVLLLYGRQLLSYLIMLFKELHETFHIAVTRHVVELAVFLILFKVQWHIVWIA